MSDLWKWVDEVHSRAVKAGDKQRVLLIQLQSKAFALRESDPNQALAIYEEGRRLAAALAEPWWVLFYDDWRLAAKMHFQRDYNGVLDLAVQSVLEIRKPCYDGLPLRTNFQVHLIDAYLGIDPHGYSDLIRQAQDHLAEAVEKKGPPFYRLLESRRDFALAIGDLDSAESIVRQSLSALDADGNRHVYVHYGSFDYDALCEIAFRRQDRSALAEAAPVAEDLAKRVGHRMESAAAQMWRALAALYSGERAEAQRLLRLSIAAISRLRMPPKSKYFDALCGFMEAEGKVENQLDVRVGEWTMLRGKGRIDAESQCRLKRCQLLARLGRPLGDELTAAREAAGKLRDPAPRLAELAAIENQRS